MPHTMPGVPAYVSGVGTSAVTSAPDASAVRPRALWVLDDGLVMGGGQLFALRLARWARRPVTLVCPEASGLWARASADGIACVAAAFPAPSLVQTPALIAAARGLRRTLAAATARGDIVVSGAIRCSLVAAPALAARPQAPPLVHLMHERDSAERASVRLALRGSRRVLAVGAAGAAAYRAAMPAATVGHVNNFLAPDTLAALASLRERRAARTDGAPPRLGVLARVIPEKGIATLVGELAAAPDAWSTLAVAGALQDAGEVDRVRTGIAAAGLEARIALRGPLDDVPGFLVELDALVVPSTGHEGQPTAILEAVAAGLPVVARAAVVSSDFEGLPVRPYSGAAGLAAALRELPARAAVPPRLLRERYGIDQVLAGIERAAA